VIGGLGNDRFGLFNDFWVSVDGKKWDLIEKIDNDNTMPNRKDFCAVVIKDHIWIIAGLGDSRKKLKDIYKF